MLLGLRASGFTPWLRVFGPDGQLLQETRQSGTGIARTLQLSTAGIHRVLLGGETFDQAGTYQLSLLTLSDDFTMPDGEPGGPLTNGVREQGELQQNDFAVWTFPAQARDGLMVRVGASAFTPWLRLIAPTGELLDQRHDSWSGNRDNYVSTRAPVTGTYLVVVSPAYLGQSGAYTIDLGRAPAREGDGGTALVNGATHSAEMLRGGLDLYRFDAQEGDGLMIRMGAQPGSSLSPWIRLYGPDGGLVEEVADTWSGNRDNFVTAQATASGVHTVIVSAAHLGQSGGYRLHLAQAPGTFVISADDEGGPLEDGQVHPGTLTVGDLDLWSFAGTLGETVTLTAQAVGFTPWIRLYRPDGSLAGDVNSTSSATRSATLSHALAQGGGYTVVVAAVFLGQSGSYDLQFTTTE